MIDLLSKDFKSGYDRIRLMFIHLRIVFNKSELRAYSKVRIISERYDIDMPEELIKGVKYYASHYSNEASSYRSEIKNLPNPNRLFSDTLAKIDSNYEKEIYLEWLIEKLPILPVPGTFNVTEYHFYKHYYSRAVKYYDYYVGNFPNLNYQEQKNESKYIVGIEEEVSQLIKNFTNEFSKTINYSKEEILAYLTAWMHFKGFSKRRAKAKEMSGKKFSNLKKSRPKHMEDKWSEYLSSRTRN